MKRAWSWLGALADGAFIIVIGCSVTGALWTVYYMISNWRIAWKTW